MCTFPNNLGSNLALRYCCYILPKLSTQLWPKETADADPTLAQCQFVIFVVRKSAPLPTSVILAMLGASFGPVKFCLLGCRWANGHYSFFFKISYCQHWHPKQSFGPTPVCYLEEIIHLIYFIKDIYSQKYISHPYVGLRQTVAANLKAHIW